MLIHLAKTDMSQAIENWSLQLEFRFRLPDGFSTKHLYQPQLDNEKKIFLCPVFMFVI